MREVRPSVGHLERQVCIFPGLLQLVLFRKLPSQQINYSGVAKVKSTGLAAPQEQTFMTEIRGPSNVGSFQILSIFLKKAHLCGSSAQEGE